MRFFSPRGVAGGAYPLVSGAPSSYSKGGGVSETRGSPSDPNEPQRLPMAPHAHTDPPPAFTRSESASNSSNGAHWVFTFFAAAEGRFLNEHEKTNAHVHASLGPTGARLDLCQSHGHKVYFEFLADYVSKR